MPEEPKPIIHSEPISDTKTANSPDWVGLEQILTQDEQTRLFGLVRSFSHAFNGIKETFLTERNFKIQLVCSCLVLLMAAVLKISLFSWLILIQVIALVLTAELINTALEHLVDLAAGSLYHPLARAAKDTAAGAVLISCIFAVVSGLFIFGPYLLLLYHNVLKITQ